MTAIKFQLHVTHIDRRSVCQFADLLVYYLVAHTSIHNLHPGKLEHPASLTSYLAKAEHLAVIAHNPHGYWWSRSWLCHLVVEKTQTVTCYWKALSNG
jgi:hypothetical protein